jgi:PAS domain S-box-containing protein
VRHSLTDLGNLKIRAEDFLAAVLQTAVQPIWVVDTAGLIRFANPAAVEALGYDDANELLGRPSHETIHYKHPDGSPYPAAECPMLLPRVTGETVARDLDWFFRRDGSMFPVSYVSAPIDIPDGRGAVVAFADIEDRLRAEQRLHERDAALAAQQASLRRVGTLVAGGASAAAVFSAIAQEVSQVLGLSTVQVWRFESDGTATVLGTWNERAQPFKTGSRWSLDGSPLSDMVQQNGRPARIDDMSDVPGPIAAAVRAAGSRSGAGAPIVVDGAMWGLIAANPEAGAPLADAIEDRLAEFTELVATAIATLQARSDLAASRARIMEATDAERRRVVRDLHDGAQQRLVHTVITLKLARSALENAKQTAPALVAEALDHAEQATAELRELAHGILPAALTEGGLRAGVEGLASRVPVPVEKDVSVGRLPAAIEATAYFVVAEALTNVAKHARAGRAEVTARIEDGTLAVRVRDDGMGGARPEGSGLTGLADRLAVLDGRLRVESPADGGTMVEATIPLPGSLAESPRDHWVSR